jgi:Zn-dependent peptidase ImmA (M78 family)
MSVINKIPSQLIRRFQQTAPVDIRGLAEDLGLKIWESSRLPEGISGKLFVDEKNGGSEHYSIPVNSADAYVRKRFTVAHEIAHFILHRDRIGEGLMDDEWYRSGLTTAEEGEANRLAADILMPPHLISQYLGRGLKDPEVLAKQFQVSVAAMRIQLTEALRLLTYNSLEHARGS